MSERLETVPSGPRIPYVRNYAHESVKLVDYYNKIPQILFKINKAKVGGLNLKEGTHLFAFWFNVSTYLPIFTACVCSLANVTSLAALASTWRKIGNIEKADPGIVYRLNAVSLGFGAVANFSVMFNFNRLLNYKISQLISIVGFFVASMLLLTAVLVLEKDDMPEMYTYTEGFWFAVITCGVYFVCSMSCALNYLGFLLGKYPPDFNLSTSERALIIYTFVLAVWFCWGSAVFAELLNRSYAEALYFCIQSLLTIGMGDIYPDSNASRGLAIFYSLFGFIIIGLIVVMIRNTIVSSNIPVLYWNQVEIRRIKAVKKLRESGVQLSPKEAFELMRGLKKEAKRHISLVNTGLTLMIWINFWFIGSLVFSHSEPWSYFEAVYFCFTSWLTIGYGNPELKSAAGRAFFSVWALGAVPLMTALISNLGDWVYEFANSHLLTSFLRKVFNRRIKMVKDLHVFELSKESESDLDEDEKTIDNSSTSDFTESEIIYENEEENIELTRKEHATELIHTIRKLVTDSKRAPKKIYDYEFWRRVSQMLRLTDYEREVMGFQNQDFWLGEDSPMRLPINEPDYLLFFLFERLEEFLFEQVDIIDKNEAKDQIEEIKKTI